MATRSAWSRSWRAWGRLLVPVAALLLAPSPVAAQAVPEDPNRARFPLGDATFLDAEAALDRLSIRATGLAAPAPGEALRVWIVGDEGTTARYLGDAMPDETGTVTFAWDQPAGENLLSQYSQLAISLETAAPGAKPGGTLVRAGKLDPASLAQVRRLLVRWPDSRYGVASVPGLRRHAYFARDQAWVLREAADHGDWDAARRKAEQLVNLVEGRRGQYYADHDGNGRLEDPGDGTGFLAYCWGALTQSQFMYATATDEGDAVAAQALQAPVTFALMSAGFVRDAAREVARSRDPETILDLAGHLVTATGYMLAATDPDGDPDLEAVLADHDLTSLAARARSLVTIGLVEAGR